MLNLHIIQPSISTWGAPCILVCKPLEKGLPQPPRFVVDYRGLNTVTSGDGYPIPSVSNVLDALSGGKTFAKLDLTSGDWQVLVNPDHVHKTAFATHLGWYEFTRMPYGLKMAPQTFQRILNSVFADFLYQWLIIYIDDVIVWANTDLEALSRYELVFECAAKFGIQFKPTKCAFFSQDLEILGHRVTPLGWFPTSKGTEAISAMPRPHNVSSVKRFLGMVNYFRDYVHNMASRTKHLRPLLCKGTPFVWTDAHEAEFNDLKDALLSPDTMLYHPNWNSPFELHTDASKHGIGAMLAQWHHGKLRPVKFASRSFTAVEGRWPTTHQELFAVKHCLEHFRPYLLRRKLKVITDHANLQWLTSISLQQSKLARWCLSMAEFNFTIEHRAGSANIILDVLSRAPLTHSSTTGDDLFLPPQPVTCFLTSLLGFDIPYLDSSRVSKIFNDTLTCLTLACNPLPFQCLATCPKSHPYSSQSKSSPPSAAPLDKDPLVTPSLPAEPTPQAPDCADSPSHVSTQFFQAFSCQQVETG